MNATTHPKRRFSLLGVVGALALVAGLLTAPQPASAATPAGTFTGRVSLGSTGTYAGAGDVVVTVERYVGNQPQPLPGISATTDASGTYTIEGLENGRYDLVFAYVGSGPYVAEHRPYSSLFPGNIFNTTLPFAYVIAGRVSLDTAGNYAGAGEVLVTASNGALTRTALTDASGRYDLGKLMRRSYGWTLTFDHLGDDSYPLWYYSGDSRGTRSAAAAQRVDATTDRSDYDVVVGAGASLSGTLVGSDGGPVEGARVVVLIHTLGWGHLEIFDETTTDTDGEYRFRALPNDRTFSVVWGQEAASPYAVGGWPDSSMNFTRFASLTPGIDEHISGLDGTLYLSSVIDVSVGWPSSLDAAMEGPGEAHVQLQQYDFSASRWSNPSTIGSATNDVPSASLGGLAPGRYRVSVTYLWAPPPFATKVSPSFDLREGEVAEVGIQLKKYAGRVAPSSSLPPYLHYSMDVGERWSVNAGAWNGFPAPTLTFTWLRCNAPVTKAFTTIPSGCVAIPGQAGEHYFSTYADVGKYITVLLTAKNASGAARAGALTEAVTHDRPRVQKLPTVSGSPLIGAVLTSTDGTWTAYPVPTITRAWLRCSQAVTRSFSTIPPYCTVVAGATNKTYTVTSEDAGAYLTAFVTATNSLGTTATGTASTTTPAFGRVPSVSVGPKVTGAPAVDGTLTANPGTWKASPAATTTHQWLACTQRITATFTRIPTHCTAITDATGATYTLTTADLGRYLTIYVTATNIAGTTRAGAPTTLAVGRAPAATKSPTVTGRPAVGTALVGKTGVWTGTPKPTISRIWLRCSQPVPASVSTIPASCSTISRATGASYTQTTTDLGRYVTLVVTATSTSGTTRTVLPATTPTGRVPSVSVGPKVTGAPAVDGTLTANPGTWKASPAATTTHQWLACTQRITATFTRIPTHCTAITDATGATYTPTTADLGRYLTIYVTATNIAGTTRAGAPTTLAVSG